MKNKKEISIPISWALKGICPRCGYYLIKYSLNYKCARCDFKIDKNSNFGKAIAYKIKNFSIYIKE